MCVTPIERAEPNLLFGAIKLSFERTPSTFCSRQQSHTRTMVVLTLTLQYEKIPKRAEIDRNQHSNRNKTPTHAIF